MASPRGHIARRRAAILLNAYCTFNHESRVLTWCSCAEKGCKIRVCGNPNAKPRSPNYVLRSKLAFKAVALGKDTKIPSSLDAGLPRFPRILDLTPLDYETTQVIIEFSKQAPEDPYFTLGELEERGELECRVYDFDHLTHWKSSTIMLIFESHLVS